MIRTRRKVTKANSSVGRPRHVTIPAAIDHKSPESAPSLMEYYRRKGDLQQTQKAQMLKARNLFVTKAKGKQEVCEEVGVPLPILEQWIVLFDWQEKRDQLLFKNFRKVHTLAERAKNIDHRHDRIAGTLEALVEQFIHDHFDPSNTFSLEPKDVRVLATSIRDLQGVRRIVHDKPTQRVDVNKTLTLDTDGSFENMRGMIESFMGATPQLEASESRLEVSFAGDVQDAELEEVLDVEGD